MSLNWTKCDNAEIVFAILLFLIDIKDSIQVLQTKNRIHIQCILRAMTEWELQDQLTLQWIKEPLTFQGKPYYLVAWELMFPSWGINNKKKKWSVGGFYPFR